MYCAFSAGTFNAYNENDVIRWEATVDYKLEVFVIDAQRFLKVRQWCFPIYGSQVI